MAEPSPADPYIRKFFSNKPCDFPGCESLRVQYNQDAAAALANAKASGKKFCAACVRNGVIKKYRQIIKNRLER
jgi:hypothetical protein